MATRTISTKLAIEGESQYRQAIKNCNSELATMKSQLALLASQYQNDANSLAALTAKGEALGQMYDKQKQKVDTLREAMENAKSAQNAYASQVQSYKEKIAGAEQELEKLKDSTGDTTEEQAALTKEIEEYKAQLVATEQKQEAAARGVNDWQRQLNYAERDLNNLDAELQQNNRYLQEARTSADGCATSIDNVGREMQTAAENSDEFGNASASAVDALSAALAAAGVVASLKEIKDAMGQCVGVAARFEAQMSTVQSISGASEDDMSSLTETAQYMGATTQFTAVQAGQALEYMGMVGWKAEQMISGLPGVMNLAAASGEDLGTTSDIVTDALTAFGLKAEDSAHFADVLAKASSNSNTNVAMMGETFKYAGSVAGALGYSIEDTAVAIGAMANAGIKSEMAGTALRGMLTNLAKPSDEIAGYMDKLGISLTETSGAVKPLNILLGDMREKFSKLTDAQKAEYAAGIAGKTAMSGMLAIVNAAPEDWNKLTDAIANCNGAAEDMAQIRLDNYQGQVTLLESAMEGLQIAVGSALTPALSDLAGAGADVTSLATQAIEQAPWLVQAFTALTVGVGVLTAGIAGYTAATKIAEIATTTFTAILETNPVFLAATAIAALTAALGTFVFTASSASSETKSLMRELDTIQQTHEKTTSQINATAGAADQYISKLEKLEAQGKLTDVQQLEYKRTVEQLNTLIPDLNLTIDEQTGLLDGGTEALRENTEAWAENATQQALQEQYSDILDGQAKATIELTEHKLDLQEAQQELNALEAESAEVTRQLNDVEADSSLAYEEKANKIAELQGRLVEISDEYGDAHDEVRNYKAAVDDSQKAVDAYSDELERLNDVQGELDGTTADGVAAASDAKTAFSNLEKACEAAETAYNEAAQKARESIDDQIGQWEKMDNTVKTSASKLNEALQSQVQYLQNYSTNLQSLANRNIDGVDSLVNKLSDGSKESAAILAGLADASDEEITQVVENLGKVEEGKQTFSDTVAGLEPITKLAMNNVVAAANRYKDMFGSGSDSAQGLIDGLLSKTDIATGAGKALYNSIEAGYKTAADQHSPSKRMFRNAQDTLQGAINGIDSRKDDLEKAMKAAAEIAIKAFGEECKEAEALINEFVDYYNDSLQMTADNAEIFASVTKETLDGIADAIEEIEKKQESMRNKLQDYGDLFKIDSKSGKMAIESLDDQIAALHRYEETLNGLRDNGIDQGLLDEITSLGVDEATQYGQELLKMIEAGDGRWEEYNEKWREKQETAKKIAENFYKNEIDTLKNDYEKELELGLEDLKSLTFNSGVDAMEGLMAGLQSKKSELYLQAQEIADQLSKIINSALSTSSSKKDGSHALGLDYVPFDGYVAELHKGERVLTADEARAYIAARTPASFDIPATRQVAEQQTTALVNAIGTLTAGMSGQSVPDFPATIVLQTGDGIELARWLLPSIREAAAQSPEMERDF